MQNRTDNRRVLEHLYILYLYWADKMLDYMNNFHSDLGQFWITLPLGYLKISVTGYFTFMVHLQKGVRDHLKKCKPNFSIQNTFIFSNIITLEKEKNNLLFLFNNTKLFKTGLRTAQNPSPFCNTQSNFIFKWKKLSIYVH